MWPILLAWLFAAHDPAQSVSPSPGRALSFADTVRVTAARVPSLRMHVPGALTVIDGDAIGLARPAMSLDESLAGRTGVFSSNRYNLAQDVRISMRGFGARAAFGTRGIQMWLDGVPLTLADGQTQSDIIDAAALQRMEILRGPVSALYGNASGGVIRMFTEDGPAQPTLEARTVFGEDGLSKTVINGGGQSAHAQYFANSSHLQLDGFRDHSAAESWTFNGKVVRVLDSASDLTLSINSVYSPEVQDPGGLTDAQAVVDPRQAAPTSIKFDTGEKVSEVRAGLVYRRDIAAHQDIEAAAYYARRDLENRIPFTYIDLGRNVAGGRVQYRYDRRRQQIFAGVDAQAQLDDRQNRTNVAGARGSTLLLDQGERAGALGVFAQDEIALAKQWWLTAGGRYDALRFRVNDHLLADGNDTGSRTFDQATGRLGVSWNPRAGAQLYANIAQSFETPTSTELVNKPGGGGGINPDLVPQRAINYEVGSKVVLGTRATADAALYYIQLQDELIAFRDSTDRVFYRNAGRSRRIGAEAAIDVQVVRSLRASIGYTLLDAEFQEYDKNGVNLDGNRVPGLPRHQLSGSVAFSHSSRFYAAVDTRYVSDFFANDENTVRARASTVVDVRAGGDVNAGSFVVAPFLGVQNLFGVAYLNNVRINAPGNRYFEPGPDATVYGGLAIRYRWQ